MEFGILKNGQCRSETSKKAGESLEKMEGCLFGLQKDVGINALGDGTSRVTTPNGKAQGLARAGPGPAANPSLP